MASFRNLLGLPVKNWDSRAAGQVLQLSSDKEHWEFGAGGGGGSGIHIDDRVDTYAELPATPTEGDGATYLVSADGLLYVYSSTSGWPAEGAGEVIAGSGGGSASLLASRALALSPEIYWKLNDDASSTSFVDSSGNGHDIAIAAGTNIAAWPLFGDTADMYAASIQATGLTDDGGIPNPTSGSWTFACMLWRPSFDETIINSPIFSFGGGAPQWNFIIPNPLGHFNVWWRTGGSNITDIALPAPALNKPQYITIRKDSSTKTVSFFIDGFAVASETYSSEPDTATPNHPKLESMENEAIGHLAFFNTALTDAEVRGLANAAVRGY